MTNRVGHFSVQERAFLITNSLTPAREILLTQQCNNENCTVQRNDNEVLKRQQMAQSPQPLSKREIKNEN